MDSKPDTNLPTLEETERAFVDRAQTIRAIRNRVDDILTRLVGPAPAEAIGADTPPSTGALYRLHDLAQAQQVDLEHILATISQIEQGLEGSKTAPEADWSSGVQGGTMTLGTPSVR